MRKFQRKYFGLLLLIPVILVTVNCSGPAEVVKEVKVIEEVSTTSDEWFNPDTNNWEERGYTDMGTLSGKFSNWIKSKVGKGKVSYPGQNINLGGQ